MFQRPSWGTGIRRPVRFYENLDDALFVGFSPKKNKDGSIAREPVLDEEGRRKLNPLTGEPEFQDVLIEDTPQEVFEKM